MLANIAASDETGAEELTGKTREEVMELFTFSMPDKGEWKDGELPMWGVSDPVKVDHSSGAVPKLGTLYLIRAVGRGVWGLKPSTSEGASTFDEKAEGIEGITLTKVFFYNTNTKKDGSLRSRARLIGIRPIERRNSLPFLIRPGRNRKDRQDIRHSG